MSEQQEYFVIDSIGEDMPDNDGASISIEKDFVEDTGATLVLQTFSKSIAKKTAIAILRQRRISILYSIKSIQNL